MDAFTVNLYLSAADAQTDVVRTTTVDNSKAVKSSAQIFKSSHFRIITQLYVFVFRRSVTKPEIRFCIPGKSGIGLGAYKDSRGYQFLS